MKNYLKKHWVYILLLVALFISFAVPALGIPVSEPASAGGLWEVDGTETQLITADEIDMQTKKIINLVDPAANQDAATKKYVDDSIDTDVATHAAVASLHTTTTTAAVSLYVDAGSGSDENAGTSGSPKATIRGALDALPVVVAHPVTINVRGQQNYAENNEALTFGRFSTLDTILIKTVNANDEDMYDNGVADAGGANNELIDAAKAWTDDQFNGAYVWIYAGTGKGQVREIQDTVDVSDKIVTTAIWTTNPDATSYYVIGGGATLTGVCDYHVNIDGKKVNVYGFRHTSATVYDIRCSNFATCYPWYNYHASSVRGLYYSGSGTGYAYYNFYDTTALGVMVLGSYGTPRANVFDGGTIGLQISYEGISPLATGAFINYFNGCTTGIQIDNGSGCVLADSQDFNGCGVTCDANSWKT